ncbi:MAG: hypothetical protein H7Y33_07660 [Cytophagales bacterium]|nr:hypothetical protein [Rhizobacter sp.]
MPDYIAFNSGCQPLLSAGNCADITDADLSGLSDGAVLRFTQGDRTYLVVAENNPWQGAWGAGSKLSFMDDTYGQRQLLGRYELDGQLVPVPLGRDDGGLCLPSPELRAGQVGGPQGSFVWPDGTTAEIWAGDDAPVEQRMLSWLQVLIRSRDGDPRFELATEGVHAPGYDAAALATELSSGPARRELAFVPLDQVPAPFTPQAPSPSSAEQLVEWVKAKF